MKWLAKKYYALKEVTDNDGKKSYIRDEFSHYALMYRTDSSIMPRDKSVEYDYELLEGDFEEGKVELQGDTYKVVEDTLKKSLNKKLKKFERRIAMAPKILAALAVFVTEMSGPTTGMLSDIKKLQPLLSCGLWEKAKTLIKSSTNMTDELKDDLKRLIAKQLNSEK